MTLNPQLRMETAQSIWSAYTRRTARAKEEPRIHSTSVAEHTSAVTQEKKTLPTIHQKKVYYVLSIFNSNPPRHEIIVADLDAHTQSVVAHSTLSADTTNPDSSDASSTRLLTRSGCGDPTQQTLCSYEEPWPTTGTALIDISFGDGITIWEDKFVFMDMRNSQFNITGYSFSTNDFFEVTEDTEYQLYPRFHEQNVVYTDLREGQSTPWQDWANAAVYLKNLTTNHNSKIEGGEWIATYPDVHENLIVWIDYRNSTDPNDKNSLDNTEIWSYNLQNQQKQQITAHPGRKKINPRIWDNNLYLQMEKQDGNGDAIYKLEIP